MPWASRSGEVAKRSSPSSWTSSPSRSVASRQASQSSSRQRILDRDQPIAPRPSGDLARHRRAVEAALARTRAGSARRRTTAWPPRRAPAPPRPPRARCRGRAISRASSLEARAAARPPSSATSAVSWPRACSSAAAPRRTRAACSMASPKVVAASGMTSTSCTSTARAACAPPESTLTIGSGRSGGRSGAEQPPERSARGLGGGTRAGDRRRQHGVGAEPRQRGRAVEIAQRSVDHGLVGRVAPAQQRGDLAVDGGHGLAHARARHSARRRRGAPAPRGDRSTRRRAPSRRPALRLPARSRRRRSASRASRAPRTPARARSSARSSA